MSPKLLVAEDAQDVAQIVAYCARLAWPDARVTIAPSGRIALDAFAAEPADLVVLDVAMPPPDGFAVCERIRATSSVPILMLTVRGATLDKVRALDLGADDYLTKPFDPLELQARLRALLRRAATADAPDPARLTSGDLTIDFVAHEARLAGEVVPLTPTEFRLLAELARHAGQALPHQALRERVWGPTHVGDSSDLKVFVRRLRQKLGDDPEQPQYVETVWGVGYRFAARA